MAARSARRTTREKAKSATGRMKVARRRFWLIGVAALVVAALAGTALLTRAPAATAQACGPGASDVGTLPGQCAPNFTLSDLAGKAVSLSSFRGRPVLLHFWGVPCTNCAAEYPAFSRIVRAYTRKGVAVVAVESWGSAPPLVQAWQRSHHLPATILVDPSSEVPARYGIAGTPTTMYIDRRGRVRASVPAIESYAQFQQNLARIM